MYVKQTMKLNEISVKDNKTIPKINDFFILYLKIGNITIQSYWTGFFVGLRSGFDVPEHIAPVRRCNELGYARDTWIKYPCKINGIGISINGLEGHWLTGIDIQAY